MHTIRLGPPWQVAPSTNGAQHARKFGWAKALDPNERVWLVCERVPGAAEVHVNGALVGALSTAGPFATDITSLLLPRNETVFTIASELPLGAVALEIRAA